MATETAEKQAQEEESAGRAFIVGPGAEHLYGDLKGEDKKRYESFRSMRDAVLSYGQKVESASDEDTFVKARKRDLEKIHKRQAVNKRDGVDKVQGGTRQAPQTRTDDDDQEAYGRSGITDDIIVPPFDFITLCTLFENSSALRHNIDAWVTNVHGFGYKLEPVLDFTNPEINNQIRDLLMRKEIEKTTENMRDLMDLKLEQIEGATPDLEEIEKTKLLWERIATIEKGRLKCFFDFLNPLTTFTEVRAAMAQSRELMGNAAWEVLREDPTDVDSSINQVYPIPFVNIRLLRADRKPTTVKMMVRSDEVNFEEVEVERYFRRYIRITGNVTTYYKEFGDPRVVSRKTGHVYATKEALEAAEPNVKPANEIYHWQVHSPISAYGVPRWISALLAVLGNRAAEEVNFLYFDNKAIPPMVLMVSGGRVSEQAVERLESYFNERVKGRANFHKIMIIEGVPAFTDATEGNIEHNGKLRLELKPLMQEMQQDALFQNYDQNNTKKIGRSFRQPQLLTGDTADMNRSTAEVAKAFAEEQIYQPARDEFDGVMNRHFVTNQRIHFWKFKTNAPVQRFPNDLVDNVKKSLESGAITPNEGRLLLGDAFSMDLDYRNDDWANVPPKLAIEAAREGSMASAEVGDVEFGGGPEEQEIDARAADMVEGLDGPVLAAGQTSVESEHSHRYVVALNEGRAKVVIRDAEGHSHEVSDLKVSPGKTISLTTSDEEGHSHEIEFRFPQTKRQKRVRQAANFLGELQQLVREEVERSADSFFGE